MNRWHIREWLEVEVIDRDRRCIYCGVEFVPDPASCRHRPTWDHIVNDALIVTRENIARCCVSCNASKGAKDLAVWLRSRYCRARGITAQTIATVVRAALTAD
jgi:hypothetical protein